MHMCIGSVQKLICLEQIMQIQYCQMKLLLTNVHKIGIHNYMDLHQLMSSSRLHCQAVASIRIQILPNTHARINSHEWAQ